MAVSEREPQDSAKLMLALKDINRRLELVDAIENPIERAVRREHLLELHDSLQAEIDAHTSK